MTKRRRKETGSMLRKPPKRGYVESLSIAISERMARAHHSPRNKKKKRESEGERYMSQLEHHV